MFSLKIHNGKPVYRLHAQTVKSLQRVGELLTLGGNAMHQDAAVALKVVNDLLERQGAKTSELQSDQSSTEEATDEPEKLTLRADRPTEIIGAY